MPLRLVALAALLVALPLAAQEKKPEEKKKDPSEEVFKPATPMHKIKITVDPDALKVLKKEPRKYIRCTLEIGKERFEDVGIHLKGAAGSTREWDDRPALTLNMDKFKKGQTWQGLDKFHLNNSVQDGSVMNEILASEMYRAIGVPTARATQAVVELNGRKVGLYLIKEGYDGTWLTRNFPNADSGLLYDGGFLQDIDAALELDHGKANDRADLKALVKACQEADANKRYEAVGKLIDVDLFVKRAAVQSLTGDWDGYDRNKNNYRLYFPPNAAKAVFIPHGFDQLWQNPGEGLLPGWNGMLSKAILEHPDGKKKLFVALKELVEKQFKLDDLNKRIDEWAARAKGGLDKEVYKAYEGELKGLKDRLKQRSEAVAKELPKLK
jgi:spore coat protein H